MVPAAIVDRELEALAPHLADGDIVIDRGNSYYRDDVRRAQAMRAAGRHHADVGTSGGIGGEERGYCLMIGGEEAVVRHLAPIFAALAPGVDATARTRGRSGKVGTAEEGYPHCGPSGAGHFVKMVHNGIEYGVMTAYAEGQEILHNANVGRRQHTTDAEATPMRDPEFFRYDMNLPEIAEVWRRGSVIGSWLLDLTAGALLADPQLEAFCALRPFIDSWRSAGVPWHLRAGKRLARSAFEVEVQCQPPSQQLFDDSGPAAGRANCVRFRLQPDASIALAARIKRPGKEFVGDQRELYLSEDALGTMSTYERLLGDALTGDAALFTEEDAVTAARSVVEPVLAEHGPALPYAAGSRGPEAADALISGDGGWHEPAADAPARAAHVRGALR